jgi:ribonuclease III
LLAVKKIYNLYFSPSKSFARKMQYLLGFLPSNIHLYKLALNQKTPDLSLEECYPYNNERLEFLGDAILGALVADYLYNKYPQADEGFLTKMRSKIVKRNTLNEIAERMGLETILKEQVNGQMSRSMLGNALEALIGAIYIEKGYNWTRHYVIHKILRTYLNIHDLEALDDNYKSQLLEWCQKYGKTISFDLLEKYKLDKRDRFRVGVVVDGTLVSESDGYNKKGAEQAAAELAMRILVEENPDGN